MSREVLNALVATYLANGGKITKCPANTKQRRINWRGR